MSVRAAQGTGVFPLPAVQMPRPSSSRSRRLQQRARRAAAATSLANDAIQALNTLHSSMSSSKHTQTRNPTLDSCNSIPFSKPQLRAVAHVQACAQRYVSRLDAASVASSRDDLFSVRGTSDLFSAPYAFTTDAVPLAADRVALPAEPGSCNLLDVLPPDLASAYSSPNADLFRPADEQQQAPSACLVRSDKDYIDIIRKMNDLQMVTFTASPVSVNGMFGTPKTDGKLRLVIDARPSNAIWVDSPKVELPAPDLLSKLEVPEGETLFVCKSDLDNYYHRLRLPEWMHPYFALPPVAAADVGLADKYGADTKVYPCCATLPMGWSHSAFLAQKVHEHLVDTLTEFDPADRITRTSDYRVDRVRHFIYIDDFGGVCLARHKDRMARMQNQYNRVLAGKDLPPKLSKQVKPSCDGVECIGVEVHGVELTCGVHPTKLAKLVNRTRTYLRRGHCTGFDMAKLIGHWTWVCMGRRCTFAVFNAVYRYIETAGRRDFDIWPSVARELRLAMALVPLMFSSLCAPWFPQVLATDASETGQGVVAAVRDPSDIEQMARVPVPVDDVGQMDRTLHPLLRAAIWKIIVSAPFTFQEHINVLELRALTTGVRWVTSHPAGVRCRLLTWCDSLVVLYAVRKGRSSAHQLLRRLRALCAIELAFGVHLYCNWIPTEVNPADVPSRRYEFDSTLGYPGEGPPRNRSRHLVHAAFAPATLVKYDRALAMFLDWLGTEGEHPATIEDLDQVLCDWIHHLYLTKGGAYRSYAEACMCAIYMYMPTYKGKLGISSLALRGWRRLVPSEQHPPLTWELSVCVAVRLACVGKWSMGLGVLLAFDCYLRVGELCGLVRKDVALPLDVRLGSSSRGMALRLANTKTGPNQWVTVRSHAVQVLLRRWLLLRPTSTDARMFPFSTSSFRTHFKAACASLGLSSEYVPHSLRHGGATHDSLQGMPLEDILRHGRWASTKSARHYIQSGRALLLLTSVPPGITALARTLVPHVLDAMTSLSQMH